MATACYRRYNRYLRRGILSFQAICVFGLIRFRVSTMALYFEWEHLNRSNSQETAVTSMYRGCSREVPVHVSHFSFHVKAMYSMIWEPTMHPGSFKTRPRVAALVVSEVERDGTTWISWTSFHPHGICSPGLRTWKIWFTREGTAQSIIQKTCFQEMPKCACHDVWLRLGCHQSFRGFHPLEYVLSACKSHLIRSRQSQKRICGSPGFVRQLGLFVANYIAILQRTRPLVFVAHSMENSFRNRLENLH